MGKSAKRRAPSAVDSPGASKKARTSKSNAPKKQVSINDLAWAEVTINENLDDWEGLYGLEEVEGVEIVRDTVTGKLSWMAAADVLPKEAKDSQNGQMAKTEADVEGLVDDGDEWNGFEDEDSLSIASDIVADGDSDGDSDSEADAPQKSGPYLSNSSFAGLEDETLEDEDADIEVEQWQSLGISPEVLGAITQMKYRAPTRIQSAAIPEILSGHDVIGKASTGSGKTLAFGIPIFEAHLQNPAPAFVKKSGSKKHPVLALILAPTRELAHQIGEHFTTFRDKGGFNGPRIAVITGGLSIQKQQRMLETADIAIGTPGRLWEIFSSSDVISRLKNAKFLVLDEADRLLSDGHYKELEQLLTAMDRIEVDGDELESDQELPPRQTLVFSATFNKGLQRKLASSKRLDSDVMSKTESMEYLLKKLRFREEKPKFVDADPKNPLAQGITEELVECNGLEKVRWFIERCNDANLF
jgi:ATP-dependent RNA helicase DDX24/MAK5